MKVIRIPTKFSRTIRRLSKDDRLKMLDSLLDIGDGKQVKFPNNQLGEILRTIYTELINIDRRLGEYNQNWKGGKTSEAQRIRNSEEYKRWRTSVFNRDNYTCKNCNIKGGRLNAHHIEHFAKNKEKRLDISNGITLCIDCHILEHKKT